MGSQLCTFSTILDERLKSGDFLRFGSFDTN